MANENVVSLLEHKKFRNEHGGGSSGGGDMTKYVTKEELDVSISKVLTEINENHVETTNLITLSNKTIDHNQSILEEKLNYQNENVNKVDGKVNTIIGIGVSSIIIPILLKILGL
ncbi:hypothetical protein M4I17_14095 [Enterococcus thailandicus]|jgi:hypothetical protein|uniref:hypothetical protein n=1 Tax=Enterococcus thailandicus TaxID=417368 RepID=UPI002543845B|nr:hypothetical protein [Enterococcus thailandicus]MDK4353517.1 hypothetical protein [Enterococcus thailandicus]